MYISIYGAYHVQGTKADEGVQGREPPAQSFKKNGVFLRTIKVLEVEFTAVMIRKIVDSLKYTAMYGINLIRKIDLNLQ